MILQPECNTIEDVLERHDRELAAFRGLNPMEQARFQVAKYRQYTESPWEFLSDCVLTLDQVNQDKPIKPFPSYLKYLEFLTRLWQMEKLIAIPKSRRMVCSWNFISLYTHDTIFNPGRFNAFVSKKEDDSGELVARAEFIYNKIPEWRIPRAMLPALKNKKMSKQPPLLEFEDINSKIQGFPQGSDQLRQFTLSGMLFDEWAFWDQAQSAYSGSKPTLDGGGRLTGISSRSPGFFKKIVFDQLDSQDLTFRETPPVPSKRPMEGVEVWKNPKNKFVVVDLHYTADPRKRGDQWREAVRNSMPVRDFLMEYERSWQTFEGKPVYADYNRAIHAKSGRMSPDSGVPILLGVDFGLTPAIVICQPDGRRLRVLKEFVETDGSIDKLGNVVWSYLQLNYLPWIHGEDMIYMYVDPAGFQRAQTDARTCVDILRKIGFKKVLPGPIGWEVRRKSVEDYLTKTYGEGPGLEISEDECPILIEGFGGGYQYPEKAIEIEPTMIRPLKNKYSHCFPAGTLVKTPLGRKKIEDICVGEKVIAPGGEFPVTATMNRPANKLIEITFASGCTLRCTPEHPIWSGNSFVRADALQYGALICTNESTQSNSSTVSSGIESRTDTTWAATICTDMCGRTITAQFLQNTTFIIKMVIAPIMRLKTWRWSVGANMRAYIQAHESKLIHSVLLSKLLLLKSTLKSGMLLQRVASGIANMLSELQPHCQLSGISASNAARIIKLNAEGVNAAFVAPSANNGHGEHLGWTMSREAAQYAQSLSQLTSTLSKDIVVSIATIPAEQVYDLTVETAHCFYANGVLVSNCHDALQYVCWGAQHLRKQYGLINMPVPTYGFTT